MSHILSGGRGLAGVALVFVTAWALVAVLLLTGTLVAAHQIGRDVLVINPSLKAINANTGQISLAVKTKQLTGRIRAAAVPLSGELAGTLSAAQQIEQRATSILGKAQSINGTVGLINGNVLAIGNTVAAIGGNVLSIASNVDGIHQSVQSISQSVSSVGADVASIHDRAVSIRTSAGSINATAKDIVTRGRAILATGRQIIPRVNGINFRAFAVTGVARGILSDFAAVLAGVGLGNAPGTVDGNANAIDCATLFRTVPPLLIPTDGPTTGCNR